MRFLQRLQRPRKTQFPLDWDAVLAKLPPEFSYADVTRIAQRNTAHAGVWGGLWRHGGFVRYAGWTTGRSVQAVRLFHKTTTRSRTA
ncbi:MAG: hypothetical protein HY268_25110 [Deltaproteobacteria bacterium]|nr:hypothetical protein [Deltaproteobacteria bacterium]